MVSRRSVVLAASMLVAAAAIAKAQAPGGALWAQTEAPVQFPPSLTQPRTNDDWFVGQLPAETLEALKKSCPSCMTGPLLEGGTFTPNVQPKAQIGRELFRQACPTAPSRIEQVNSASIGIFNDLGIDVHVSLSVNDGAAANAMNLAAGQIATLTLPTAGRISITADIAAGGLPAALGDVDVRPGRLYQIRVEGLSVSIREI